jgi:thioredoxin 1
MAGGFQAIDAGAFDGERLREKGTWLVEFGAAWCPPCRAVEPVLASLAQKHAGRLSVAQVDSDEEQELGARFLVTSLPTMLVFRDGELVERLVGAMSEPALARRLAPHLG